jgi:hypothetical protein
MSKAVNIAAERKRIITNLSIGGTAQGAIARGPRIPQGRAEFDTNLYCINFNHIAMQVSTI